MVDDLVNDAKERMAKSVEATRGEFQTVRTGRANPQLLDRIVVDYYGSPTPLNRLAGVQTPDPRSLVISPYDTSALGEIERAIQESDLGLTPSNDGKIIRLAIPQLTEERRKELVKVVRQIAEDGRVAVRNVRRDAIADIQSLASEVGADELHRAEEKVQKLTDDHVGQIDAALKQREADIMEV
ncbi:MAG: ribosome recycling factor [Actinobacteria bacterium]|nr:ribosome recycling factor [Actinomycetota bacterium]